MTMTTIDRSHLSTYTKARARLNALWAVVLVIGVGFWSLVFVGPVIAQATEHTEQVSAVAVEETTVMQTQGSRRNRHIEEVRALVVEFEFAGTQYRETLATDDEQLGDVTVYLNTSTDRVAFEAPEAIDFWGWFWGIAGGLVLAGGVIALVGSIAGTVRLSRFDPSSRTPELALDVTGATVRVVNQKKAATPKNTEIDITAVAASATEGIPVGTELVLTAKAAAAPGVPQAGSRLEGMFVKPGAKSGLAVVRFGADAPWWPVSAGEKVPEA
ncbi:hypothetical protein [Agromyces cerinus]|uniref:Uncharacterized protein n=1 Tax=Agromyces cerinus subsp. cerinus TaxID=232089 RepID=A0A1N6G302_9MICO|nr:hypothetical protein [Agromyces cerinus]SIO01946.1 hypothetical protein SAMN05443544_2254 [Agromyces cerinus subsp. cerinus]